MNPRNSIVLIQTDSHDGRLMGCMGHATLAGATPHMDRLAAEGALLEQAYCNFPLCCPSRASLWSGRYPHRLDAWNNSRGIAPDAPTFVTRLAEADYRTHVIGRTDHLSGAHSLHARVSSWTRAAAIPRPLHTSPRLREESADPRDFRDWAAVRQACAALREEAADDRPFLLYLGLHMPHHPFFATPELLGRIPLETVDLPPEDQLEHPLLPLQRLQKGAGKACEPEAMRRLRRAYFATITEIDRMLGEVLTTLDATGLGERVWVVFCSDHGEMAGEHRQYLKQTLFEASLRVPLLVRGPGVRPGLRIGKPVSLIDLPPTLFELTGTAAQADADGCSFAPELGGAVGTHPGRVFAEYHASACPTGAFMLRRDNWKYLAFPGHAPLLFNLRDDPDELRDLSAKQPGVCQRLDAELRTLADYEVIDARAKADDRECFRAWREQALQKGTYADLMADLYGRAQKTCSLPWRKEDEEKIAAWLAERG